MLPAVDQLPAMATLSALFKRQCVDDFGDMVDCGPSWWYSTTGYAVRYTITAVIILLLLLYFVGGYMHAVRRLNKGLAPLAYHRVSGCKLIFSQSCVIADALIVDGAKERHSPAISPRSALLRRWSAAAAWWLSHAQLRPSATAMASTSTRLQQRGSSSLCSTPRGLEDKPGPACPCQSLQP